MIHVGATLRRLRLESGLSLRDLARRLGVSSAYVSRMEHGLDAPPTPERLEAIAIELGVPQALLLEVGHRLSPFVQRYAEQEPTASALFLSIARAGLGPAELAQVHRYVERQFGRTVDDDDADYTLAPLLDRRRIVLRVHTDALEDAVELGSARLASVRGMPPAPQLAASFLARASEIAAPVGGGVAVQCALVPHAASAAALVTLAPPLPGDAPDGMPISVVVLICAATHGRETLMRVAHVARLGARGLTQSLAGIAHPDDALERVTVLETIG